MRLLLLLVASPLALACGESAHCAAVQCGPCPPTLSGFVVDATSDAGVTDAMLTGDARCTVNLGQVTCHAADSDSAPQFRFGLSAPRYQGRQFVEKVSALSPNPESCCNCPHLGRNEERFLLHRRDGGS